MEALERPRLEDPSREHGSARDENSQRELKRRGVMLGTERRLRQAVLESCSIVLKLTSLQPIPAYVGDAPAQPGTEARPL